MATVFDNPYIKQLGLLPMEQTPPPQPLEGILGQRGLVGFGLNMLANPNENFGQQFAQGLAGGINAVDAYNQQLNKNAQQAAEYNLKVGQLAANYDLTDRELDIKEQAASAGAPLQQLLMAQMFGIKPTMPIATTEPVLPPEPMIELDTGILPIPQEPAAAVGGGLLGNMVPSGEVGFREDVQGGYIDTPVNPMLAPPVNPPTVVPNAKKQQGEDLIKIGGVSGSAPLVSAGKELSDIGSAEQKKSEGQRSLGIIVNSLADAYKRLNDEGAAVREGGDVMTNIGNYISSTDTGQIVGAAKGTKAQGARQDINSGVSSLLLALKPATEAGAKSFDSNADVAMMRQMAGDPKSTLESNARQLQKVIDAYAPNSGLNAASIIGLDKEAAPAPTAPSMEGFKIRKIK